MLGPEAGSAEAPSLLGRTRLTTANGVLTFEPFDPANPWTPEVPADQGGGEEEPSVELQEPAGRRPNT